MDIYKTRLAKKFFPRITIVDESNIINNIDIYVDPRYLCRNDYWINLLYPEGKGFNNEKKYLFSYDSTINPLSDIEKNDRYYS